VYRHAKHALASAHLRSFIRKHAVKIVENQAFTPERIRRFVVEAVPQLAVGVSHEPDSDALSAKIAQEIKNPTDRMRKSFHALSLPHKWMLLSLLESGHYATSGAVLSTYREQYGESGSKPSEILEELTEAFVIIKEKTQRYVEWIHPSYRDLVIEQLKDGGSLKSEFLSKMNVAGIKLALSDTGGSFGKLRFPLINSPEDWDTLRTRTLETAGDSGVEHCTTLLTVLTAALDGSVGQEKSTLLTILKAACQVIRERWNSEQVALSALAVSAYATASERTSPMEPMPALEVTWQGARESLTQQVKDEDSNFLFDCSTLDEFLSLVEEIANSEPRLLRRVNFPAGLEADFEALLARVDRDLASDRDWMEKDEYDSEADASLSLAASLKRLQRVAPSTKEAAKSAIEPLTARANRYREKYQALKDEEEGVGDYSQMREEQRLRSSEPFDVDSVFVDL
jgi:hypothetical protein